MSATWVAILALAGANFVVKAAPPVLLGGRRLPPRLLGVVTLLASALMGALVVVETVTNGKSVHPDARLAGVGAAALVLSWKQNAVLPAVLLAAVVTAAVRAVT
jgi:branched chain amino acid efflux pump